MEAYSVTPTDAARIDAALQVDASDYYYSSCMSIVDGLRAIDTGFYTWSTVKMYYAVFYAVRAIIAWDGVAVFYPDAAPFRVAAKPGARPVLVPGKGTHRAMFNCFRKLYSGHILLTSIGLADDAFEWLLDKREEANYRIARFTEPQPPGHYAQVIRLGVRKAVAAYLDSANNLLRFDEDHAILSFPLATLRVAGDAALARGGAEVSEEELDFLQRICRERNAELAPLRKYLLTTFKPR